MKKLPEKLYHYCSVENMYNIFNSKSLWLSNSHQMNDSEESTWIEQYLELIALEFVGDELEQHYLDTMEVYEYKKTSPFIFCLSEKKDSLSQWRAYSTDGKGVCIGFSTKILKLPNYVPIPHSNADHTIGLVPVEYNKKKQKEYIIELAKDYKFEIENKLSDWDNICVYFGSTLRDLSLSYKNPSFEEEKEWRIIHTPPDREYSFSSETEKRLSDIKFRVGNNKIITYHEYDLKNIFSSQLINEIVLGPKSKLDIPELQQFLKYNNLVKTKILKSASTYR